MSQGINDRDINLIPHGCSVFGSRMDIILPNAHFTDTFL